MKKILAMALALVLSAAGVTVWLATQRPAETGAAPLARQDAVTPHERQAAVPGEAMGAGPEVEAEIEATAPPARRVRHGVAAAPEAATEATEPNRSDDGNANGLARQVEKALAGDTDELVALSRLLTQCSRLNSEDQVLRRLERMARFEGQLPGGPRGRADGGSVEFQSFEDMESDTWARFDACQAARDVLDEDLYEQIERLAEQGVAAARYLYAVWAPAQDTFGSVSALELLEYQTRALEYTWANLEQRDPLGLLAMSQSYSAFRPSLFTPTNPVQGQVFLLAAMKCGIDNDWLTERAVEFGQGFSRFQAENTRLPSLDEDAAALAGMFCPETSEDE